MKRSYMWALATLAVAAACTGDDAAPAKQADAPVQTVQAPAEGNADLPPVTERELTP